MKSVVMSIILFAIVVSVVISTIVPLMGSMKSTSEKVNSTVTGFNKSITVETSIP